MKQVFGFLTVFFILTSIFAEEDGKALALLSKVDDLVSFENNDLSAEYTIVTRELGGGGTTTVATMFRRDRKSQFLILILEPIEEKGKGYLKLGDSLWLYDPIGKTFTFTSAKERFQNSNARNSDFDRSNFSKDYRPLSTRPEKLGAWNCSVLELQARNDTVAFPKVKLWVSEDNLVRKIEDYSLSGQLMRTTAIVNYQKVSSKWIPANLVILDHLRSGKVNGRIEYERTTISIKSPTLTPLPDSLFTKEYLERVIR